MVLSPNAPTEVLTIHQHKRMHLVMVKKKKKNYTFITYPRNSVVLQMSDVIIIGLYARDLALFHWPVIQWYERDLVHFNVTCLQVGSKSYAHYDDVEMRRNRTDSMLSLVQSGF